jgi:hypothetical protein
VKYPAVFAVAVLAAVAGAPASFAAAAAAPTPPPPPPNLQSAAPVSTPGAAPSPTPAATPAASLDSLFPGAKASASPGPGQTPTPPPDERKGLDGVWEVEIQHGADTIYEHMNLKQTGATITGTYLTKDKKAYPVAGSLDGKTIRLIVSLPDGSTMLLEGRVDGTTDMLGLLTLGADSTPFTAAYRPKEKWSDNVNAVPGGLGGNGGVGGGGVPPRS